MSKQKTKKSGHIMPVRMDTFLLELLKEEAQEQDLELSEFVRRSLIQVLGPKRKKEFIYKKFGIR